MQIVFDEVSHESGSDNRIYNVFSDLDDLVYLFPAEVFQDKNRYEEILDQLFYLMIDEGTSYFSVAKDSDNTLTPTNFLKKDRNYYRILKAHWPKMSREIKRILKNVM